MRGRIVTIDVEPDNPLLRLRQLDAALLRAPSATVALERWCALHRISTARRLVAERVESRLARPDAAQRRRLRIDRRTPVRYRRVRLRLGGTLLSDAENWYVPSRLTAPMRRLLDRTDTPFGRVVRPLAFRRRTVATDMLWDGGAASPDRQSSRLVVDQPVLRHRAILVRRDGLPFSEVIETYAASLLSLASGA